LVGLGVQLVFDDALQLEVRVQFLDDLGEARDLVGVETMVQALTQPVAQQLDLPGVPQLQTDIF